MKIAFIGTHSTGKTTVLDEIKKYFPDYLIYTEIIREMIKKSKISINEESTVTNQSIFFNYYLSNLIHNKNDFISDRSIIDVFCYTTYLYQKNPDFKSIYEVQKEYTLKYWPKYDYLFYFPIEFDLVDDGIRSKDSKFREEIAKIMESFIKQNNIKVYEVRGSVDERVSFILKTLNVKE